MGANTNTHNMPAIVSLAILKVNWDEKRQGYLDLFIPFVAECLRSQDSDVVSLPELQSSLKERFDLHIPQNAIKSIVRRMRKPGYVRLSHGSYYVVRENLDKVSFGKVREAVLETHASLLREFQAFCRTMGRDLSIEECEEALTGWLTEHEFDICGGRRFRLVDSGSALPKSAKYLVGVFIESLRKNNSPSFEYVETIMRGNMLANALFLRDPGHVQRSFSQTSVFFDTSFLMYALGFCGKTRQEPCQELLELLYETGADLRCFAHTADEIRRILYVCQRSVAKGSLQSVYGSSIKTVEYFLQAGLTASDIELLVATIEQRLKTIGIKVSEKPDYVARYVIDEVGLANALRERISYSNYQAVSHDVDCISAIMRLREGRQCLDIERCRAIFVTTNSSLARVSREFLYGNSSECFVLPAITDYTLTNLLWLKKPSRAPGLLRKRLIAECFAAVQPDDRLWRKYLDEIAKLTESNQVTADDYYLLRYSLEAKTAMMMLTLGDEDAFTEGTVQEVLEMARRHVQAEVQSKLEQVEEQNRAYQRQAAAFLSQETARKDQLWAKSLQWAKTISAVCFYGTATLLVTVTILLLPGTWTQRIISPLGIVGVGYMLFMCASTVWGFTLKGAMRGLESRLAKMFFTKLCRLLSVEEPVSTEGSEPDEVKDSTGKV